MRVSFAPPGFSPVDARIAGPALRTVDLHDLLPAGPVPAALVSSTGIAISGVVNQYEHDRVVSRQGPSKYPPAFGIDLHVDDSEGVAEEGRHHRFRVVVVSPGDSAWAGKVLV